MGVNKNISQDHQELFERYLLDQMNKSEKESFEAQLTSVPDFKESFEHFKSTVRAIEEAGLRSKLNDYHSEIEGSKHKINRLNSSKKTYSYFVAASVTLILFFVGYRFFIKPNSNENLYSKYYTVDPGLPTVMGQSGNYDFYKTMVSYKQGKYELAIMEWKTLLAKRPDNDTLNYFLGSAYLAKNNVKSAVPFLKKVVQNKKSFFYEDSQYYLGLIYLKENDIQKAKAHLLLSKNDKSGQILRQLEHK